VGCYDRPLTLIFGFFAFTCFHLLSPAFTGRHVTGDGISAGVTRLRTASARQAVTGDEMANHASRFQHAKPRFGLSALCQRTDNTTGKKHITKMKKTRIIILLFVNTLCSSCGGHAKQF
jgi:hypothetical protein